MINGIRPASRDPLLATAKVATILVRIGLIVGMIGLGIAFAVSAIALGMRLLGSAPPGAPEVSLGVAASVVVFRFAALMTLGLANDFFNRLAQIIDTVGAGDPFVAANADRIHRMGWLALIAQLLSILLTLLASLIGPELAPPAVRAVFGFWLGGLVLSLTLFVLARVFRRGTEMRDELEGTV